MLNEPELISGSDNVYADFGYPDAGLRKARATIAARIVQILDVRKLSTRDASKLSGVSHAEFSRIRNAQLQRFTLDRLIAILGKIDADTEVLIGFVARPTPESASLSA